MLGYKMNMANNVSVRVAVSQADQKYKLETAVGGVSEIKLNGKWLPTLKPNTTSKCQKT